MFLTPQYKGRLFEKSVHKTLEQVRNAKLYNETEIRAIDKLITAIDHLLIYENNVFCFQDKLQKSNISNSIFNHFIKCVEMVANYYNNSQSGYNYNIYGIYVTNAKFSSIALMQLESENKKNNNINIRYFKFDSIEDIINFLHINGIFMYDTDGDAIIL